MQHRFDGSACGGQIETLSYCYNSTKAPINHYIMYPDKGCKQALSHSCFSCPVAECIEVLYDMNNPHYGSVLKRK